MSTLSVFFMIFYIFLFNSSFADYGAIFYVSLNGKDSNPGTMEEPFQTLNHARDIIRSYNQSLPSGGVLVYIRGGTYNQLNYSQYDTPLLDLNIYDSGTQSSPIVYSAYPGEKVQLIGGYQIPSEAFLPSSTYPNLLMANLSKINADLWNNVDFGNLASGQLGTCANKRSELFVNEERMILARWPNIYFDDSSYPNLSIWNWTNIEKVVDNQTSFVFNFSTSRAQTWLKEVQNSNTMNSPWLHGYWSFDWADSYTQIEDIDVVNNVIYTYADTPPVYGYKKTARYYGVNLLSELDTINEYFIDIEHKLVYIHKDRQSTLSSDEYFISVNPIVINVAGFGESKYGKKDYWNDERYWSKYAMPTGNALREHPNIKYTQYQPIESANIKGSLIEYITISNISIGYATQIGVYANDISNSLFSDLNVFGVGEVGIAVSNGYNNSIENNKIAQIGCHGLNVDGGDEMQLIRGNNVIRDNFVKYYAQWKRTYQPGIAFGGVGNEYIGNYVGYAPHQGMTGGGNDLLFENNTFDMLCYEVSDSGGWYAGRSWTHRGSVINNNVFMRIKNVEKTYLGSPSVQGVYLDDQLSGHNVTNNEFIDCMAGIMLGGGRRVQIHNNKFAACGTCVLYDDRGLTWQTSFCQKGGSFNQQLDAVNYTNPPWSAHYPYLPDIFNEQPCTPVYDRITENEYCCGQVNACKFIDDSSETCDLWNSTCKNNVESSWNNQHC